MKKPGVTQWKKKVSGFPILWEWHFSFVYFYFGADILQAL